MVAAGTRESPPLVLTGYRLQACSKDTRGSLGGECGCCRRPSVHGCLGEMSLKEAADGDWPHPSFSRFQGLAESRRFRNMIGGRDAGARSYMRCAVEIWNKMCCTFWLPLR